MIMYNVFKKTFAMLSELLLPISSFTHICL
jgi:hypothetical protein